MGVLPHAFQNLYPENKTDLDFYTDRNEILFLFLFFKEERKHNSKKEKSRVFPGSKWPETIVRSF